MARRRSRFGHRETFGVGGQAPSPRVQAPAKPAQPVKPKGNSVPSTVPPREDDTKPSKPAPPVRRRKKGEK